MTHATEEDQAAMYQEDRFVSPCSPPTAHEAEILDILIEECAEVIQRATKMKRFGVKEVQRGQPHDNAHRLSQELGDLSAVAYLASENELVCIDVTGAAFIKKMQKLEKFMQTEGSEK